MEDFKNPLKSKTVIFGLLQITVAICALLLADGWIQTHPRAVTAIGLVSGIATIVLRFLTTAPIAWPSEPAVPGTVYRHIPANTELRSGDEWAVAGATDPVWTPIAPEQVGRVIPPFSDYIYRRPV